MTSLVETASSFINIGRLVLLDPKRRSLPGSTSVADRRRALSLSARHEQVWPEGYPPALCEPVLLRFAPLAFRLREFERVEG